jgi:hypothetical protein
LLHCFTQESLAVNTFKVVLQPVEFCPKTGIPLTFSQVQLTIRQSAQNFDRSFFARLKGEFNPHFRGFLGQIGTNPTVYGGRVGDLLRRIVGENFPIANQRNSLHLRPSRPSCGDFVLAASTE